MSHAAAIELAACRNRWADRHPGEKAVVAAAGLALSLGHPSPLMPVVVAVVALGALRRAGIPPHVIVRTVLPPVGLLAVAVLPLAFRTSPSGVPVLVDGAGLVTAASVWARSGAGLCAMLGLSLTTRIGDLVWLLMRAGVPAPLVDVALSAHRFLFSLGGVVRTASEAQRARCGFTGWLGRAHSAGQVAAVVLVRAIDRAEGQERALDARGGWAVARSGTAAISWRVLGATCASGVALAWALERVP